MNTFIKYTETVDEIQYYKNKKLKFDPDSSPEAISYFKLIYNTNEKIKKNFDFFNCECSGKEYKRLHFKVKNESNDKNILGANFKLSGDVDFNFNEGKIKNLINKVPSLSDEYKKKLTECHELHHTLINMSLMPTTGGMNLVKGQGLDRMDKFLVKLNNFYQDGNEVVLNKVTSNNRECLKSFLKVYYEDIYDYCKQMYFIEDRKLVNDLIAHGQKDNFNNNLINDFMTDDKENKLKEDFLMGYIDLANRFWNEKKRILK